MSDKKVVSNGDDSQGRIIEIDEQKVKDHLGAMVRESVEDTLNAMLEAEAEVLCGAARYERTADFILFPLYFHSVFQPVNRVSDHHLAV